MLVEVADLRMLPEYLSAGLGVAVVPDVVPLAAPSTVAAPLRDPGLTWPLSIVTHSRNTPSRALRTLLDLIAETRSLRKKNGRAIGRPGE